jgi:hypothetical protein
MYVTAQRVENERGAEGVHVFVYVHGEGTVPGLDWTTPDAGFVADVHPGQLLFAVRSISGERLAVRSFLDVAFSNAVADSGAWLLRRLVAAWPAQARSWPISWTADNIGGRFYTVAPRRAAAESELRELHEALLPILATAVPRQLGLPSSPAPVAQPLVIVRRRTPRGFEFRIEDTSQKILESVGVPSPHPVLTASLAHYDAFEVTTGRDFEDEIVSVLTKLSLAQLDALGGAEIIDEHGAAVWASPELARRRA